jgi:hypothetical protein
MTNKLPFSKLRQDEKDIWLNKARRQIYPGLEPYSEEKEKLIQPLARELYYDAISSEDQ